MANVAEGASATILGAQNEATLTRQLPLHRQSAHFELCVGGSMADCGYSAVLLFWRRMLLEMSGDQIQSAMRAAQLPRWCLSKNGNIHSDAVGVEDDKFN